MLLVLGPMSLLSWYGYRSEPCERRTALKFIAAAGVWFLYLFWAGPPLLIESSFIRIGLFVLSLALAINAHRLLLGIDYLFVKHWADSAISSALRSGRPIDAATTIRLGDRSRAFLVPGLKIFFHKRKAEEARALRDKVYADAQLAEAIVRRERAREEAAAVSARRREKSDAWRKATRPRVRVRRRQRQKTVSFSE
jgi:hypothetical protein